MQSVAQVEQAMQSVFSQADHLAQQSGFVQRSRKLTGKGFLQTLVLTWWNQPHASREMLASMAASLGIPISAQGISARLDEAAASFLYAMLAQSVTQVVTADPVGMDLLQRFGVVMVRDSSTIQRAFRTQHNVARQWRTHQYRHPGGDEAACRPGVGARQPAWSLLVRWPLPPEHQRTGRPVLAPRQPAYHRPGLFQIGRVCAGGREPRAIFSRGSIPPAWSLMPLVSPWTCSAGCQAGRPVSISRSNWASSIACPCA